MPEFAYSGEPFRFSAPPKTLPLLARMLLHRRNPFAREALAFAFWPDAPEEEARSDLRRHLYYLTKALPVQTDEPWLVADKKTVAWNPRAPVAFDVADFEGLCAPAELGGQRPVDMRLDDAVALYRGPLLEGYEDEWITAERERLETLAKNALARLIARDFDDAPARAIAYAQHLLRVDPWREDAIRALVRLRFRAGDRAGAVREYREFALRLRADLDVAPMAETTAAYDAVAGASSSPPASRTNLPARAEALIGRERALEDVRALLATTRIATLAGTGGVGKTRLALEAGWAAQDAYRDGVWFADCAPAGESSRIAGLLVAALGVAPALERSEREALVSALRQKQMLLIIDNCEHVVAEVAEITAELLARCPGVRILVTSREPLAIRGERVYRVPSLDVPAPFESLTLDRAREYGAVALFEARATAVAPSFALDEGNVPTVIEICRRLDGIALAIELAAARAIVLSPSELLCLLAERFRILTGGERTALPRARTMRALIDWSWGLCTESERVLLRRLSVFAGGWTLEAAQRVCFGAPLDASAVVESCAALVQKSLLVAEPRPAASRYRLLESIRDYALERLEHADERVSLQRRHAEHFADFGARMDEAYETQPDATWHACALAELENVRAALAWSLGEAGDTHLGASLASSYGAVWEHGSSRSDREALDRAYERLDRAAHPALTARLLWQIASISHAEGRHASWVGVAVRNGGDARTLADALGWLAGIAVRRGDLAEAQGALDEAARLTDPATRPKAHAALLRIRGELAVRSGDLAAGTSLLERAIAAGRLCGATAVVSAALVTLADAVFAGGDIERAVTAAAEARTTIAGTFGRTVALADVAGNLAAYRIANDDLATAGADAREALSIASELDFPQRIVVFVERLAVVAGLSGDARRCAFLLGFTEAQRRRREMPRGTAENGAFERACAAARAELGEDELAASLARGAAAGPDRAIAEALIL